MPWCSSSRSCILPLPPSSGPGSGAARGTVGGLEAGGHAAFLGQSEPALNNAVVLGFVNPRVLMARCLVAANFHEHLVHELDCVVRPEALDVTSDVGQEFLRRRNDVGRAVALEGVYPSQCMSDRP